MKNISFKFKLATTFLFMGLIPVLILSYIFIGKTNDTLIKNTENTLKNVNELKTFQIEELFSTMKKQVKVLSKSEQVISAMENFNESYKEIKNERKGLNREQLINSLKGFYQKKTKREFSRINPGKFSREIDKEINKFPTETLFLQNEYLNKNKFPLGQKDKLIDSNDQTSWSLNHKRFHPFFREFLKEFGFYDIFLIGHEDNRILYSVFKEIDFGTSLSKGPFSKSNFSELVAKLKNNKDPDFVGITDLNRYFPSYNQPAAFIGVSIFNDNNVKIGALVIQIPLNKLERILNKNGAYELVGLGKTGDSFVVGSDKLLRTNFRSFVKKQKTFLKRQRFIINNNYNYMKNQKSASLALPVSDEMAKTIFSNERGYSTYLDYKDDRKYFSYKQLKIPGLDWLIVTEKSEREILSLVQDLKIIQTIILIFTLFIILVFSVYFAKNLSKSIDEVNDKLRVKSDELFTAATDQNELSGDLRTSSSMTSKEIINMVTALEEISRKVNLSTDYSIMLMELSKKSSKAANNGKLVTQKIVSAIEGMGETTHLLETSSRKNNNGLIKMAKTFREVESQLEIINEIVFKTELLSFNASIEAAAAGEHGRGFMVVADEVKSLANTSGKASKDIFSKIRQAIIQTTNMIQSSVTEMEEVTSHSEEKIKIGRESVEEAEKNLNEILRNIKNVDEMAKDISSYSHDQSMGLIEILKAMNLLESMAKETDHNADKTFQSAKKLNQISGIISKSLDKLQEMIKGKKS